MPESFDNTDAVIARKLAEIAPPAGLRARLFAIEAGPAAEEARPANWWARGITAIAAVLVATLAALSLWPRPQPAGEPIAAARTDMATFLSNGFPLEIVTSDVRKVRDWLAAQNPNHSVSVPDALAQHPTIGCRELSWRGHRGSLACFKMGDGREAHLAMFPTKTFADAPGSSPKVAGAGAWTSAAWSRDGMTYILFVPAGMDPMKELIGAMANQRAWKIAWAVNQAGNLAG